ncbi:hypothetical protein CERSUDRAFT_110367 [Gelatoporia subvermispora B]|uniref:SCP domain-containing protein n=1 Tax=Ceriporiopsis subvermispora (strain B) TaxID=914234 RepID=M2RBH3_CERS8|nr:hypothetical protein CERSUDRAFT_110367 [Gelatoporia subvermispora B]
MGRFALLISSLALLSVLQNAQAGPACARRNEGSDNCLSACASKWGWPGREMGTDPWGQVMTVTATDAFGAAVTKACRVRPTSQSAPAASSSATQSVANIKAQPSSAPVSSPVVNVAPTPSQSVASGPSLVASLVSSAAPSAASLASSSSASVTLSIAETSSSLPSSSASPEISAASLQLAPASSKLVKVARPSTTATPSSTPAPAPTSEVPSAPPATTVLEKAPAPSPASPSPSPSSTGNSAPASGSTNASGGSDGGTSQSDIDEYLADHNTVRAQHGAAPLTWNNTLADKAQQWANGCVFQHSGGTLGPFGENLAAGTGSSYGIDAAIQSWTSEVSQYDPSNPQPSHFTQVVWKATTEVGCAVQTCNGIFDPSFGPAQYFVCEYFPQGNVVGEFPQNVQV